MPSREPPRARRPTGVVVIRDVVAEAWRRDPLAVVLSVPATVLAVVVVWLLLVVAIVSGTPA